MSHVHRQLRQLRLHIRAGVIPAHQGLDGKTMTEIVDPWPAARRIVNPSRLEEAVKAMAQPCAGIGSRES